MGMHHSNVAVNANTCKEGDADIDISEVQSPSDPAGQVSEYPVVVVEVVMNPARQGAQKYSVHHSQVDNVHI